MSLALPLFLISFSAPSAFLLLMHLWGAIRPYQLTHPTALLAMLSCLLSLATHDPPSPMLSLWAGMCLRSMFCSLPPGNVLPTCMLGILFCVTALRCHSVLRRSSEWKYRRRLFIQLSVGGYVLTHFRCMQTRLQLMHHRGAQNIAAAEALASCAAAATVASRSCYRRITHHAGPASSVGLSQSTAMSSKCSSKSRTCWWRPSPNSCAQT